MSFNVIKCFLKNIQLVCTLTRKCSMWKLHFAWVLIRLYRLPIYLLKLFKDKRYVVL